MATAGPLRVGPRDGSTYGARIDFRGRNALQISLGGWVANTQRFVVDAYDSVAKRISGPVDQHLIAGEATFQFNLTGGKSWHGLAPYAAVGLGLVHGAKSPRRTRRDSASARESSSHRAWGARLMVNNRIFLRVEARSFFWSLKYPPSYSFEPIQEPGTAEHPNAVNTTGKSSQYVASPALTIGLGIAW